MTATALTEAEEVALRDIDWSPDDDPTPTIERLLATIDAERQATDLMARIIQTLLTRSPIDGRGACFYCNLYAGQIEVRGQMQYVARHDAKCVITIAQQVFRS